MPISKSAKKALRQSQKRRRKNLIYKKRIKKLQKEMRFLLAQGKSEEAKKLLPQIFRALDKAAKERVIKKNQASRQKSKASRRLLAHFLTAF